MGRTERVCYINSTLYDPKSIYSDRYVSVVKTGLLKELF